MRAAGWALWPWLAVHPSTRGETWPQGAFSVQPLASRVRYGVLDLEAL